MIPSSHKTWKCHPDFVECNKPLESVTSCCSKQLKKLSLKSQTHNCCHHFYKNKHLKIPVLKSYPETCYVGVEQCGTQYVLQYAAVHTKLPDTSRSLQFRRLLLHLFVQFWMTTTTSSFRHKMKFSSALYPAQNIYNTPFIMVWTSIFEEFPKMDFSNRTGFISSFKYRPTS